jgi:hypothetical protein
MSIDTVKSGKHLTPIPRAGHDDTEEIIEKLHPPCKHYGYEALWSKVSARLRANTLEIAHLRRETQRLQHLLVKEGVTI